MFQKFVTKARYESLTMGCCVSSENEHPHHQHQQSMEEMRKRRQSSMGVGMGVAMMMQQAGALVGAAQPPPTDISVIHSQIRKAKAEGRTVTLVNGALYFDYQLVARIPPHYDIRI